MIKKLNITLVIACVIGAIFIGGVLLYDHFTDIRDSNIVTQLKEKR